MPHPYRSHRCIGFLLFLVAAGVVVAIVLTIVKPNFNKITAAVGVNVTNLTNILTNVRDTGRDLQSTMMF